MLLYEFPLLHGFDMQVSSSLYLGGCLGVESLAVRDQAALAARVAGAK